MSCGWKTTKPQPALTINEDATGCKNVDLRRRMATLVNCSDKVKFNILSDISICNCFAQYFSQPFSYRANPILSHGNYAIKFKTITILTGAKERSHSNKRYQHFIRSSDVICEHLTNGCVRSNFDWRALII